MGLDIYREAHVFYPACIHCGLIMRPATIHELLFRADADAMVPLRELLAAEGPRLPMWLCESCDLWCALSGAGSRGSAAAPEGTRQRP